MNATPDSAAPQPGFLRKAAWVALALMLAPFIVIHVLRTIGERR